MTITKEMTIEDVVTQYPESMMVFMKHGLHCVGCHVSAFESVEDGAKAHGINVEALVADLNKVVSTRKTSLNSCNNSCASCSSKR